MDLTAEQVTNLAPDTASAAAGKKLASFRNWQSLGRDSGSLWGLCQGSAVYQVRVDLSNFGYGCSCPSRKFPCKHVLGLLLLAAQSIDAFPASSPPDWVSDWLTKRQAKSEAKAAKTAEPARAPDEKAQAKRAEDREQRVLDGMERLELWMDDQMRNGLAGLESQPAKYWDDLARRLVDAQAPGLASRVRRWGELPGSSRDWPRQLLEELGKLKLALLAFRQRDRLPADLVDDLRQLIGWTIKEQEVLAQGEAVEDEWCVYGQWVDDEDRVRSQRTWVVGRQTGRHAMVLQFAPGVSPFAESILVGTRQRGVLAFYPGASRQRARFRQRDGTVEPLCERIPGWDSVENYLRSFAERLAAFPWTSAAGCVLRDVTLICDEPHWVVCDRNGDTLPLRGRRHWTSLALSGGRPCDLMGEWDGRSLRPLSMWMEGRFRVLET